MKKLIVSCIVLGCLFTLPALAVDRYVDGDSGNDSDTGTSSAPFLTITKALTAISGGDTIYCKGTVTDSFTVPATKAGSAGALTTITNWPSNTCIVDGNGATQVIELADGANYIKIDGLNIIDGNSYGILSNFGDSTTYLEISNNTIYGIDGAPYPINIYLDGADYSTISGNTIYGDGTGDTYGVWISSSPNLNVEKNEIYDFTITGLAVDHDSTDSVVKNNRLYNIGGGSGNDLGGIHILNTYDVEVYNNTLYNCQDESNPVPGIRISTDMVWGSPTYNITVKNNIVNTTDYGIHIDANSTTGFASDYNDLYNNTYSGHYAGSDETTLTGWQTASSQDSHSIDTDPKFISVADSHLQSDSPAIDAGVTLIDVADDYDDDARPQGSAYDIGFDEVVSVPDNDDEDDEDDEEIIDYTPGKVKNVNVPKKYRQAKRVKVTWKKKTNATGYIIRLYKYNKKTGKYKKTRTVKVKTNKKKKVIKKLKPKTKYKVKVRAKRKVEDTVYKGPWSKAKKFRTKRLTN